MLMGLDAAQLAPGRFRDTINGALKKEKATRRRIHNTSGDLTANAILTPYYTPEKR